MRRAVGEGHEPRGAPTVSPAIPPDVLWLDGMPDEAVVLPTGEPARALGCDPFAADPVPDPFTERLLREVPSDAGRDPAPTAPTLLAPREGEAVVERREAAAEAVPSEAPSEAESLPERERRRRWVRTPRIDEVELPDASSVAERLLDENLRRRLAALTHLSEGGAPYDRYGFSPLATQRAFPFFHALYRLYFRVRSEGHDRLPTEGPAVLASNHGGLLPFDGAMTVVDVLLHSDPPRLPRAVVDHWAGTLPFVNVFYARVGQVIGTRENVTDLLDDGQLVLVFPEGMDGVRKRVTQRNRVQRFRVGFVEAALRARAPIVPMAVIGSDDQAPILFDLSTLARRLSLPFFPITPTFPWFGPLGLLPYPVGYRIVYGDPLPYHERFGPEGADDPQLVRYLANQVRREIQTLVDRHR